MALQLVVRFGRIKIIGNLSILIFRYCEIFSSQKLHCLAVFGAAQQHAGFAENQNIGELAPIFVVVVDDERDLRVFADSYESV